MLIIKVLHIVFVVSWFAGLFYLPRIFVNLALVPVESHAERERLLLMATKLFRFMAPLAVLALGLGVWLWLAYGFRGGWLHAKLFLAVVLLAYHHYCGRLLQGLRRQSCVHGASWFRWFNEVPVILLLIIVYLAVVKPF